MRSNGSEARKDIEAVLGRWYVREGEGFPEFRWYMSMVCQTAKKVKIVVRMLRDYSGRKLLLLEVTVYAKFSSASRWSVRLQRNLK